MRIDLRFHRDLDNPSLHQQLQALVSEQLSPDAEHIHSVFVRLTPAARAGLTVAVVSMQGDSFGVVTAEAVDPDPTSALRAALSWSTDALNLDLNRERRRRMLAAHRIQLGSQHV